MITILGKQYHIDIERKRIKNLYLSVDSNTINIKAPFSVSEQQIYAFINEKARWINKQLLANLNKRNKTKLAFNESIYYLGKKYSLEILKGNNDIKIIDNKIIIYSKKDDLNYIKNVFYKNVINKLSNIIKEKEGKYLNILKDYGYYLNPVYKYKVLSSMWGVNYHKKNEIHLNLKLIHFEEEIIEAVLWHELLHFVIPNHSKRFYQILSSKMNNCEDLMKKLI